MRRHHLVRRWCCNRSRRSTGRCNRSTIAFATAALFVIGRTARPVALCLASATRLITVIGVLVLMTLFFFFRQFLPRLFDIFRFMLPLVANNLGDFGVGQLGVVGRHLRLVMLSVQNKGISWSRDFGCWGAQANCVLLHPNRCVDAKLVEKAAMRRGG